MSSSRAKGLIYDFFFPRFVLFRATPHVSFLHVNISAPKAYVSYAYDITRVEIYLYGIQTRPFVGKNRFISVGGGKEWTLRVVVT